MLLVSRLYIRLNWFTIVVKLKHECYVCKCQYFTYKTGLTYMKGVQYLKVVSLTNYGNISLQILLIPQNSHIYILTSKDN